MAIDEPREVGDRSRQSAARSGEPGKKAGLGRGPLASSAVMRRKEILTHTFYTLQAATRLWLSDTLLGGGNRQEQRK